MKVNYNVSAMIAHNSLQKNDKLLSESLERLSSGLKIANAKDNPSGLAMSRRMNSQIEGLGVANDTSNDAISIVQVADGTLSEIHDILQRMNQLCVQASTGTLTDDDRKIIQSEITLLKDEVDRMAGTTQFNGQNILDGSFDLKGYVKGTGTVTKADGTTEVYEDKTIMSIGVVSYSDNMEAGNYRVVKTDGSQLSFTHSADVIGPTGVEKNYLLDAEGNYYTKNSTLTDMQIQKLGTDGNYYNYFSSDIMATVNEDIITFSDRDGKEIKLQVGDTYEGDLYLELTAKGAMTMQVGANEGQTLDIRVPKVSITTLGIYNLDVTTEEEARLGIDNVKDAIAAVSAVRSRLGAYQNRLEHTTSSLDVTVENMTAAYSRIMDVDMAEEMTIYSTQQVLSQAGTSMMAQANERPSQVLQLLQ
ncbi:MAG: flagellin FliC3 [Butyrivibrio sp.]|uniref:flagellin N-terminal helical domain-containing protein n=1 Tax=Butyrivibrio sp. TaxID=28121 RepID=UPI001B1D35BB|nr:flagellin [Butyrivibrio sp.]MBO6240465.1 flagellin FliC3 [Butyrivibrio sp.]